MSKQENTVTLDKLVSLAKRRGFIFQASEIYGGLAGFYDYGPYGVELVNNIKALWWQEMVRKMPEIYGIDGAIIQSPKLWKASGHVDGFIDPLVDCKSCKTRHRADHLAGIDSNNLAELNAILKGMKCPNCGKADLTEARTYNMMMKTYIGPIEDEDNISYLRPETAGAIFTNFENVRESTRSKIPFGIAQVGKAFRNEISPRDFIFRVRELEQMEMQYFIHPSDQDKFYNHWLSFTQDFLIKKLNFKKVNIKLHEHSAEERAHYCAKAHDVYFNFPFGFKELWGTHNRTNFDLSGHAEASGKNLEYFDEATREKYIPFVIESSVGVGRLTLAALTDSYHEEKLKDNDERIVLKFDPKIAPVKLAILPLMKKPELIDIAHSIFKELLDQTSLNIEYDETGSIGKRYRRQDEIGTPYCLTVDFDTISDKKVTIRDRDSMEQIKLSINEVTDWLISKIA